ncbi:NADH-quinone oxidoreductase subunit G [Rhodococcus sp. BP-349]|uniref:NADH-quinone oxidoreductase subunit G n=1 Tax=unclassified Rhodococcus (in: high G+C Gram-positive bacteria) TaxID=192944 RepID=UPI001C9B072F|nr:MULTISPECIES: NADH-quinone oxidoreductase subunit G [unclassified Rhodococcus (in: high G+C Gram-positive bacteria)]MBY6539264.1 NADH-quinone oxidoreductase subunit G [Rhodococcus sp. BP-363]MBY6544408.1 NADH-quinone oxidoreductase subunit G [Rhodococcus sp. BP-369]MBY6563638.1 NADH-quinone oxidoreductase subunit G [Rhodococcus sp. BP-370]MBY6577930.1 NADH-quinone oxidoreductase subunit G [Rhodococcus sp. BP-364]MBY6587231.1 NADH-quinone oxidoreductase subunit G [Rhodococcus sp. BP-358]
MTAVQNDGARAETTVDITLDGVPMSVPRGTLVIRAAEMLGVQIPRFCDHPLLDPVGACRQCLVDVEGQRKPLASCTTTVSDGMVIRTQHSSEIAEKAQRGVMELLLINHPLDCPVCDKGGECPLQNQAMSTGRTESRFTETKRTYPKPIPLSTEVLLDRERCVLCARCTRFSEQIAGDPFIDLLERGALQQVGIYGAEPFESYFSGNTVQICPVGALTNTAYRFRARPFDLVSTPSVCEHCSSGCAQRTDHRRGKVLRRLAGDDPEVNEEWSCDKGRWAFAYGTLPDRLDTPLVRRGTTLEPASWSEALAVAARGLTEAHGHAAVLTGGRLTVEDAYAYSKFARIALGSNDIDFRVRPTSEEETDFLSARVAGRGIDVTYAALEAAPIVVLVSFEPEEESPIVFLRLRKAVRGGHTRVLTLATFASPGSTKLRADVRPTVPGTEAAGLADPDVLEQLRVPGAVILVGERAASSPGTLAAVARTADTTGARVAWIPRRAGDRGALDSGAFPTLLHGGRRVDDPAARHTVAAAWGVDDLPATPGRDTVGILGADLRALVVAGVELDDLPDPDAARAALDRAPFVVALDLRSSEVTDRADVVFPVAAVAQKAGSFTTWEGRRRTFGAALPTPSMMADLRVLDAIATEMGHRLGLPDADAARRELDAAGSAPGTPDVPNRGSASPTALGAGTAVLAGWRMLLDAGRMQDGETDLAGTARTPVARLSPATAADTGVSDGEPLTVSTDSGSITLPLRVTAMPDHVVWLPWNSAPSRVSASLHVAPGAVVRLSAGAPS